MNCSKKEESIVSIASFKVKVVSNISICQLYDCITSSNTPVYVSLAVCNAVINHPQLIYRASSLHI